MRYLTAEVSESADGLASLEALASTPTEHHASALAEAQAVLQWLALQCPGEPGPVDDGHGWDHDLQVTTEGGGWRTIALTVTAPPAVIDDLLAHFSLG